MKFLAVLLLTVSISWLDAADNVTYTCTSVKENTKGTIIIRFSLATIPSGIYAVGNADTCGLGVASTNETITIPAMNDTSGAPYEYDVSIGPTLLTPACGAVDSVFPDSSDKRTDVTFFVQTTANAKIISGSDKAYTIRCDWVDDIDPNQYLTASAVAVSDANATKAVKSKVDATFEVYATTTNAGTESASQTSQTTITLANTCSLRVTLNNIKDSLLTKGKITNVKAASESGFKQATSTQLIHFSTGCGVPASSVFSNTDYFTADTTYNNANPTKYRYNSPGFPCFRFVGSFDLYFKATVSGCTEGNSAKCKVTCAGGGKRRRRDVSQASEPETAEVLAVVRVVSSKEGLSNTQVSDSANKDASQGSFCLTHISFISVIAVLSILLLITLGVTIFFGSKLIKNQGSSHAHGYSNQAYKA